ncbi:MAG: hypothetical protein RSC28_00225 [Bacteroidales bacterium]
MRKLFLLFVSMSLIVITAGAQDFNDNKNAIGIRAGWGVEASYQRYMAPSSRIEATVGLNRYGFDVAGTYQWLFDINTNASGQFKWYAGAGLGTGSWSNKHYDKGFSIGILGQAGIEYAFNSVPLLLSLDYRPGIYFAPETHFDWTGFAIGIKYSF